MNIFSFDIETALIKPGNYRPKVVCLSYYDGKNSGVLSPDDGRNILIDKLKDKETLIIAHNASFDIRGMINQYPELWPLFYDAFEDQRVQCTQIRQRLKNIADGFKAGAGGVGLAALCKRYFDKNLEKPAFPYIKANKDKKKSFEDVCEMQDYIDFCTAVETQNYNMLPRPRSKGIRTTKTTPPDFPECDLSTPFGRLLAMKEFHGSWRLLFEELGDLKIISEWPEDALQYALEDAEYCYEVWYEQERWAKSEAYEWNPECANQTAWDYVIGEMQANGMKVDREYLKRLDSLLEKSQNSTIDRLIECKIVSRNKKGEVKANTSVIKSLVEKNWRGPGPVPVTEKGSTKYGAEVVENCDGEELGLYTQYKKLEKDRNTYVKAFLKYGIIHARFTTMGCETGRTSCSNPNLQNVPSKPGLREAFVPRPGNVFIACDYSSMELRTWAQASLKMLGVSTLAQLYKSDKNADPHLMLSASLSGVSFEEAKRLKKEGDNQIKENRKLAKIANFGFPGGLGARGFVNYAKGYGVVLTQDQSHRLRNAWLDKWKEARPYLAMISKIDKSGMKYIHSLFTNRKRGDYIYTSAANHFFQALASDCIKMAIWNIHVATKTKGHILEDCIPVSLIHDEIIVEVPESKHEECGLEVQRIMEESADYFCTDVPCVAIADCMDRWTKGSHERIDKVFKVDVEKILETYKC